MTVSKLVVIGLDAVESDLLHRMLEQGQLPHLQSIARDALSVPVQTDCMDTLPGAIWQDILTGRSAGAHGDFYPVRLHTGEAEPRPIDPAQHGGTYFWDRLAEHGVRSVVLDPPLGSTYPGISDHVTMVTEWHVHDSNYGRKSHPPHLLDDLQVKFGARPADRCDFLVDHSDASHERLADHLENEAGIKAKVAVELMSSYPWDVAFIGMSQGHCAGHHLWSYHDAAERSGDDHGLGDSVRRVYRSLDRAIGEILDAVHDDVDVMVFTSHGMDNYVGGPQLVDEVLRALDFGDARKVPSRLRPLVPSKTIHRVFDRFPKLLRVVDQAGAFRQVVDQSIVAVSQRNNRCGAIRLNVIGREPAGAVQPDDIERVLDQIETAFMSLRHPEHGVPIVSACHRATTVYGADHHPDLPDLMVAFRQDLGLLDRAESDVVGTIARPVWTKRAHRTGDHTDHSHLWARLRSVPVSRLDDLNSLDFAPLIEDVVLGLRKTPQR